MKDQIKYGGVSSASFSSSYQVPALDGRMIQATPLKFCLKYKPPTIAVVYTIEKSKKSKSSKQRKYIHSINVDFNEQVGPSAKPNRGRTEHTKESLEKLCHYLCERESAYLNTSIISKNQVSIYSLRLHALLI